MRNDLRVVGWPLVMDTGREQGHDGLVLMVTSQIVRDLGILTGAGQVLGIPLMAAGRGVESGTRRV